MVYGPLSIPWYMGLWASHGIWVIEHPMVYGHWSTHGAWVIEHPMVYGSLSIPWYMGHWSSHGTWVIEHPMVHGSLSIPWCMGHWYRYRCYTESIHSFKTSIKNCEIKKIAWQIGWLYNIIHFNPGTIQCLINGAVQEYGCLLYVYASLDCCGCNYKTDLCHLAVCLWKSSNVCFMPNFKLQHIRKCILMHFKTSNRIGQALQQQPLSEHPSYVCLAFITSMDDSDWNGSR